MATNVIESDVLENDNLQDDSTLNFIIDIVNYAINFHDERNPPEVTSLSTRFTSNIGKAIMKCIRTRINPPLDDKIQNIANQCQTLPQGDCDAFIGIFDPVVACFRRLLNTTNPFYHISVLEIICKFCVKVSRVGRPDLSLFSTAYFLILIEKHPKCQQTFDQLDTYAVKILQELEAM